MSEYFFFLGTFSVEIYFDNNMPTDKMLQLLKLYASRCISKMCTRSFWDRLIPTDNIMITHSRTTEVK